MNDGALNRSRRPRNHVRTVQWLADPQHRDQPGTAARHSRASDLHAIRRLDWRYLLSDPHFRRVAYLGPGNDSLVDALKRFSHSFVHLLAVPDVGSAKGGHITADLVVVQSPCRSSLEQAARLLTADGLLYCELERRPLFRRSSGTPPARGIRGLKLRMGIQTVLRSLGFREITIHWHFPNFEECRRIIPAAEPAALEHLLRASQHPIPGPLARALARGLARTGILFYLMPCVSIVARKWDSGARQ
jgi:hypothetical protein